MTRQLITTQGSSPDSTLYTLIASVESNYLGFTDYMKKKGVPVIEERLGSKAYYSSIGIDLKVGYLPGRQMKGPPEAGEPRLNLGTLVILSSYQDQDIVEREAEELLMSIKEVEDYTSVQIGANMARQASDRF